MDEPLNADEQKLVEKYYPLLEQTARKMRRTLPVEEGISAGYFGLVKAIRSGPQEDMSRWVEICAQNAIQHEAERERRMKADHLASDPADHRAVENPIWALYDELPEYLQESVSALAHCEGDYREAAKLVGCSEAELRDDIKIIQEKYSR